MGIQGDINLLRKFNEIQDRLSVNVKIQHDQVTEIVVADLMSKYKHRINKPDEYTDAFKTVLSFYLDKVEMDEMMDIIRD